MFIYCHRSIQRYLEAVIPALGPQTRCPKKLFSSVYFKQYTEWYVICKYAESSRVKACVRYFYQIFIFSPNGSPLKPIKNVFLFHLKSSFHSQNIQIFVIFSFPFHTFQIQMDKWKWNNLLCHELTRINLQM